MIDTHCHMEQSEYDSDRGALLRQCKAAGLKAVVTSCARPQDFALTMDIARKHRGFVFPTLGIHPEFIKDIKPEEIDGFLETIRANKKDVVGVGEVGLDYNWVKEPEWREKQKELFRRMIRLSEELKKPLVIHARDAYEDVVEILEHEGASRVQLHMFGASHLVRRVEGNGWFVSVNTILLKSKKHKKLVRDMPLDRLMLETDAPWLAPEGWESKRNDPRAIRPVAEKIAEIKKASFDQVWEQCGRNAVEFFSLPVRI